jgi:hypothetical protein
VSDDGSDATPAQDPEAAARAARETFFERLFPGPAPADPRMAKRLENLQRVAEQRAQAMERRAESQRHPQHRDRPAPVDSGTGAATSAPAPAPAAPAPSAEDVSTLIDALHEQTDVMRALLDADIAIRDDARSTAQNSRTFAVAGIVIAFFTLVAAAVPIVLVFVEK